MLPLALKVALSEENSSVLVHYKNRPRRGGGLGGGTSPPRYWPVTRPGLNSDTVLLRSRRRTHEVFIAGCTIFLQRQRTDEAQKHIADDNGTDIAGVIFGHADAATSIQLLDTFLIL